MFAIEEYLAELKNSLDELNSIQLSRSFELLECCYKNKNWVYIGGNGGSATIAQHFATDWTKGLFEKTGKALKSFALNSNIGLASAVSNDLGNTSMFDLPLRALAKTDDLLVLISSSGSSENILRAADFAKSIGMKTIGLSGFGDSVLSKICDVSIKVNSTNMQIIEDTHSVFGHLVFKYLSGENEIIE
jgi:D-sedoheptulose 7-phosphate isomerase